MTLQPLQQVHPEELRSERRIVQLVLGRSVPLVVAPKVTTDMFQSVHCIASSRSRTHCSSATMRRAIFSHRSSHDQARCHPTRQYPVFCLRTKAATYAAFSQHQQRFAAVRHVHLVVRRGKFVVCIMWRRRHSRAQCLTVHGDTCRQEVRCTLCVDI